jgi:hypothetical protein
MWELRCRNRKYRTLILNGEGVSVAQVIRRGKALVPMWWIALAASSRASGVRFAVWQMVNHSDNLRPLKRGSVSKWNHAMRATRVAPAKSAMDTFLGVVTCGMCHEDLGGQRSNAAPRCASVRRGRPCADDHEHHCWRTASALGTEFTLGPPRNRATARFGRRHPLATPPVPSVGSCFQEAYSSRVPFA